MRQIDFARLPRIVMASALFAQVAGAAPSPATDPAAGIPEITVVAPRPAEPHEIAGDNVATFIRAHGKPGKRTGLLGRWADAVCPATEGLTQGFNDFVTTRVNAIAGAVHVPRQTAQRCDTNVLIVFTTEPQAFLDDVVKRRPQWLGFHYTADIPRLKTVDRPIQAWYATATHSRSFELHFPDGVAQHRADMALDDAWSPTPAAALGSRLSPGMESFIVFVLVVVDSKKITDYTIGSISDYIAMMALSQMQLTDGCGELPSILDLMTPACRAATADSITAGDIAYLKALYSIDLAHDVSMQRSSIEDMMMRDLKRHE